MLKRITLKGPLGISLIAIVICAIVLLTQVPSLLGAVFSRGAGESRTLAALEDHVNKHDRLAELSTRRFDGRYLFFPPPPPPPKPVEKPVIEDKPVIEEKPPEPVVQPPPPVYGGPKIAYVIGNRVYFKADDRLTHLLVGESNDQVKVVGISPPWSVRLLWQEAEFDVVPIDWMSREYPFFSARAPTFTAPAGLVVNATKPDNSKAAGAAAREAAGRARDSGGDRQAIAEARERQAAARAEAEDRARAAEAEEEAYEDLPAESDEQVDEPVDDEMQDEPMEEGEEDDEAEDDVEPQGQRR